MTAMTQHEIREVRRRADQRGGAVVQFFLSRGSTKRGQLRVTHAAILNQDKSHDHLRKIKGRA
jgi:hypothetical protein